jgi:NlpC/P60 family putative phage cell wall peptidase
LDIIRNYRTEPFQKAVRIYLARFGMEKSLIPPDELDKLSSVFTEPITPLAYTPDWAEARGEEALWSGAMALLDPVEPEAAAPGDVLLFRMRRGAVAKHLGLLSATGAAPRFIHAYSGHGVVESPLTPPWQRRIVAVFRFPERG